MPDIVRKAFGYHIYFYWILSDGSVVQENNNDNIPENDLKRVVRYMSLKRNIARAKEKGTVLLVTKRTVPLSPYVIIRA